MQVIDLTNPAEFYRQSTQDERAKIIRALQHGLDDYDRGWIWSDFVNVESSQRPDDDWDGMIHAWAEKPYYATQH